MIPLPFNTALEIVEGRVRGPMPDLLPEISIDTRTLLPGQIYLALVGKRLDGHDFVREALQKGAAGAIISRETVAATDWPDRVFVQVGNTLAALQRLAASVRRRWGRPLIGITGSMGKTTTRTFVSALLAQHFQVLESPGNLNNEIGVPLSLLRIQEEHQLAVLELGMNHRGEIAQLGRICGPDAALLTNIAPVHLEFFSGLEEIAEAKGEILQSLRPDGRLFFNADDEHLRQLASRFGGERIPFGIESECPFRISSFRLESLHRMRFHLEAPGRSYAASVPFAGKHFLYHIAAAVAVAQTFGVRPEQIQRGLERLRPMSMRGRVFQLKKEGEPLTVWDDSYNSSPKAVESLLETLRHLPGHQRRILALGEMLELGGASREYHHQAGLAAAQTGIDLLVTVGEQARYLREGALQGGLSAEKTAHFADSGEAADFLAAHVQGGDLIVVKGSRGTHMEEVVRRLQAEPSLCSEGEQS